MSRLQTWGKQPMSAKDRREFLQLAGLAGMFSAVAPQALAQGASGAFTVDPANTSTPEIKPTHSIKFAAIGLDHAHIYGMVAAVQRGGGELVAFFATDPAQIADFRKRFGDVKLARARTRSSTTSPSSSSRARRFRICARRSASAS